MRKLLALVLIAILAFAIVGCSSSEPAEDTSEETTETMEGPTVTRGLVPRRRGNDPGRDGHPDA